MQLSYAQNIAIWTLPVLFAITLHEVAHGWVASKFGDQTARLSGRLTINPLKHIDLFGTIIVPMVFILSQSGFIFGWAKPVPVDPRNMRDPRLGMAFSALAGPLANFLMALFWGGIAKIGFSILQQNPWFGRPMMFMGEAGIMVNVVLGILNCLPIPPLDGGKILMNVLPQRWAWSLLRFEPYGFFIIVLLMFTGMLSKLISPPIDFLFNLIFNLFGLPLQ